MAIRFTELGKANNASKIGFCHHRKHNKISLFVQDSNVSGLEGPYVISSRETELESSASLRLAELERGSMVGIIIKMRPYDR